MAPRPFWLQLQREKGALENQLYQELRGRILNGGLPANQRLPSTRELAEVLCVSRSTVVAAYERLKAEGYLDTRRGSATFVSVVPPAVYGQPKKTPADANPPVVGERQALLLKPGTPDLDRFPHSAWATALGARARLLRHADLDYSEQIGHPNLQQAIIEHVSTARGVLAEPDQVVVVPSARAAINLLAGVLLDRRESKANVAWVEEPGYWAAQAILKSARANLVQVPCDDLGLNFDVAEGPRPQLIYTTPSHQYPTGVTMSLQRRLGLLKFASESGAIIIEDDYDSEFHYGAQPIPSLQGIDRSGAVVYLGTFSKILAPALRVSYMIVPRKILSLIARAHYLQGVAVPMHMQAALADFLRDGRLRAHLRRMRPIYAERMAATVAALTKHCDDMLRVGSGRDGLQLATWFKDQRTDDTLAAARLHQHGFGVQPMSRFFLARTTPGLLFGIAGVDIQVIDRHARLIGQLLQAGK